MIKAPTSLVVRAMFGLAALAGLAAAVPASAHQFGNEGYDGYRDRAYAHGAYRAVGYGYARHWRAAPAWYAYQVDHDHYRREDWQGR